MIESVFFDVSRNISKLYPVNNNKNYIDKTYGQNLKKILTKKSEIDKSMLENFLNHDISTLYTSNLGI